MVQMMSVASRSKSIASLTKGTQANILDGAKAVSDSLSDMLKLMNQVSDQLRSNSHFFFSDFG